MKRSSSARNRYEVFDFGKEDDRVESISSKILSKFANPKKPHDSPLTKYSFLQFFTPWAKPKSKKSNEEPIEVDDSSADRQSANCVTHVVETSEEEEDGARLSDHESEILVSEANSFLASRLKLGVTSTGSKCLDTTLTQTLPDCEPIGVISDDESITSSIAPDHGEDEVSSAEPVPECNFDGYIIYPEGDPDAVCISKSDVERLQPETFINDTIIDFYIKYLKNKIRPEEKHRFHFFNSFFFRKLADLDKDPSSVCGGRAAFQRVRKWTRKVNLFEKDYIFIPVNFSLHWSLIVICHPGEVANTKDEGIDSSARVPCILHMDSKRGSHRGLKNLVQSYLSEEWRERQNETLEDINLRFVQLELPQQENSFDCGLFLLHYVELFLEEAPVNFSPFQITKFPRFLKRGWFPPADASLKRAHIKKLIFDILVDNSQKISPADCNDKCPSSQSADTVQRKSAIERFEDMCSSTKTCNGMPSGVHNEEGIGISVVATSPQTDAKCIGKSELFSRQCFKRGATEGSLPNELATESIMSPIEEIEEIEEQVSNTPLKKEDCHKCHGMIVAEPSKISPFIGISKVLHTPRNPGIYMHLEEDEDGDSSSGSSIGGSWNAHDYNFPMETVGFHRETDKQEFASNFCEDLADCIVEDSQEADEMHDGNASEDSLASLQGNIIDLCREEATSCEKHRSETKIYAIE